MENQLRDSIETQLKKEIGNHASISKLRSISGGCINQTHCAQLDNGDRVLVKTNPSASVELFQREFEGLQSLRSTNTIRVARPMVVGTCPSTSTPFLVIEWVEPGTENATFGQTFGRQLAELHRTGQGDSFGYDHDNFLGATPQPNRWNADWLKFWRVNRMEYQLNLARRQGLASPELEHLTQQVLDRLPEILDGENDPPTLIHGDLWSGNFLVDSDRMPVLIDPAVYYGKREAELAMTYLFGGFRSDFYDAYRNSWPLEENSERRIKTYQIYHLMNHLNLFGHSYLSGCLSALRSVL